MSYDLRAILDRAYDFGTLDDPNHKHIGAHGQFVPCRNPELCAQEAAEAAAYLDGREAGPAPHTTSDEETT